jgi:hypothetical protein
LRGQLEEEIKKKLKEKLVNQIQSQMRDRVAIELTNFYIEHLQGSEGTEVQELRDLLS